MFKALSTIFTDFTESFCNQFSKKNGATDKPGGGGHMAANPILLLKDT